MCMIWAGGMIDVEAIASVDLMCVPWGVEM